MEEFWLYFAKGVSLSLALGFVAALVVLAFAPKPRREDAEPEYQIPPHLEELSKRLGYDRRGFREGEALSRRINDELAALTQRAEAAERKNEERRSALSDEAKAKAEAIKAWRDYREEYLSDTAGRENRSDTVWVSFPSFDGTDDGDKPWPSVDCTLDNGWKQTVYYPDNREVWEYDAGPDGKPWSMEGEIGFIPYEVGKSFARSEVAHMAGGSQWALCMASSWLLSPAESDAPSKRVQVDTGKALRVGLRVPA